MEMEKLSQALIRGDSQEVSQLTLQALQQNIPAQTVLDGLIAGMNVVGTRFKNCEIFLPEVLVAARAMKMGMAHLEPSLKRAGVEPVGKCVLGTVKGDLHDIGKNLVSIMLQGAGFEVVDLGVNVTVERFMEGIRTHHPQVVGMSALLTTTMSQMKSNIDAFREAELSNGLIVMVGGAPVTRGYAQEIGAQAYAPNAAEAAEIALTLIRQAKP